MMVSRISSERVRDVAMMVGIAVVLGLVEWLGFSKPLQSAIQQLSQPVLVTTTVGIHTLAKPFARFQQNYQAASRVEELEKQLTESLAKLSELERVELENKQLRESLGAQARPQKTIIGSPIVSYGLPTISLGSQQGVVAGSPVIAQGALIGVVETLSEQQSTVSLLTHQHGTPIVARTESGTEGLVIGDGKRVLFTEVAHDKELRIGERITTVGQEHIPANVFIGTVQEVLSKQSSPVQTASVQQLTTFYEVTLVEVMP